MNRLAHMLIMASTLILFFMPLIEQTHAKNVRSPCILTALEKTLVNELTRFHESSYFATQANIKECVILDVATILVYYENGHIGLFSSGEIIYSDRRQEQNESRDTKMPNKLHYVSDQYSQEEDVTKFYNEFINVWHSAGLPDGLSQESLAYADVLAQKLLCTTPLDDPLIVSSLGSRGNRYLAFIEGCKMLSQEMTFVFYESYLDVRYAHHIRTENILTDHDKQVVIKKVINMLETVGPPKHIFSTRPIISRQIKKFDPNSYARLVGFELIVESDD